MIAWSEVEVMQRVLYIICRDMGADSVLRRSFDMEHHMHAFLILLAVLGGVAIAERNPGDNNAAENIPAQTLLSTANHVTEEGLAVAIQSVIQTMEEKFTIMAHQMNEMREGFKNIETMNTRIEASCKEGQTQVTKDIQSAEERIKSEIKEEIKAQVDTLTSTVTKDHEALEKQLLDNITCPITSADHHTGTPRPSNCYDMKRQGHSISGVYIVTLHGGKDIQVYCDMTTDGGGWTVLQRRADITPRVNFQRGWSDYKNGFGDLHGEFWLGLDNIHSLTSQPSTTVRLRVDLESFQQEVAYAEYDTFMVSSEGSKYGLSVGGFNARGAGTDSLTQQNGMGFTTIDRDNDGVAERNQADHYGGGWWHHYDSYSCLNGPYLTGGSTVKSIFWWRWKHYAALKKSEMKIRPY